MRVLGLYAAGIFMVLILLSRKPHRYYSEYNGYLTPINPPGMPGSSPSSIGVDGMQGDYEQGPKYPQQQYIPPARPQPQGTNQRHYNPGQAMSGSFDNQQQYRRPDQQQTQQPNDAATYEFQTVPGEQLYREAQQQKQRPPQNFAPSAGSGQNFNPGLYRGGN